LSRRSSPPEVVVLMRRLSRRVDELGGEVERLRADIRMLHASIGGLGRDIEKLSRLISELNASRRRDVFKLLR